MEQERISMSRRERERLKVLHEVKAGHLTQVEAAKRMRLTSRHVRRLERRVGGRAFTGCKLWGGAGGRKETPNRHCTKHFYIALTEYNPAHEPAVGVSLEGYIR
jgi:hypothetical protein